MQILANMPLLTGRYPVPVQNSVHEVRVTRRIEQVQGHKTTSKATSSEATLSQSQYSRDRSFAHILHSSNPPHSAVRHTTPCHYIVQCARYSVVLGLDRVSLQVYRLPINVNCSATQEKENSKGHTVPEGNVQMPDMMAAQRFARLRLKAQTNHISSSVPDVHLAFTRTPSFTEPG